MSHNKYMDYRYEISALAFYKMTGMLAPGKDAPEGDTFSVELREEAWRYWVFHHQRVIEAILTAIHEVLP